LAMVGWCNGFSAFDDERLYGFGWMLGWTGEPALGEEMQSLAHRVTGAQEPQGWDHQLGFEPLLGLYWTHKRKLMRATDLDIAFSLQGALGNFMTYGQLGVEARAGDRPGGFAPVTVPVGAGLDHHASLPSPGETYTYGSLMILATRYLHAMPRDGNLWRDDDPWTERNELGINDLVGQ